MQKILTVAREDRCIGCMLCVIKASIIKHRKIDFSKSYIKIILDQTTKKYKVIIDYGEIAALDEIVDTCPRKCFEIIEINENK